MPEIKRNEGMDAEMKGFAAFLPREPDLGARYQRAHNFIKYPQRGLSADNAYVVR